MYLRNRKFYLPPKELSQTNRYGKFRIMGDSLYLILDNYKNLPNSSQEARRLLDSVCEKVRLEAH